MLLEMSELSFVRSGRCFLKWMTAVSPLLDSPACLPAVPSRRDNHYEVPSKKPTAEASGSQHWVFLGAPGVGKGTYSTRVAKALGVPHIAAGDLVRNEIKRGTMRGKLVSASSGSILNCWHKCHFQDQ